MLLNIVSSSVKDFLDVLKKEWPQSLMAIKFIETCIEMKTKDENLNISLLYCEDSMETGVFIGIFKVNEEHCAATFYALNSYETKLEEALNQVEIASKNIRFEIICKKHCSIVERFCAQHSFKFIASDIFLFSLPIENASVLEIRCPEDLEFRSLTEDHIDEIYKIWVMKDDFSPEYLKFCIKYNESCGLFCKKTGELLARCLISHNGAISALQTVEKAQNKGYAQLLLKQISKSLAEKGILPVSFVVTYNKKSCGVIKKVGFNVVIEAVNYRIARN